MKGPRRGEVKNKEKNGKDSRRKKATMKNLSSKDC